MTVGMNVIPPKTFFIDKRWLPISPIFIFFPWCIHTGSGTAADRSSIVLPRRLSISVPC